MKQLPLIPDSNDDEQTPLPLIVAQRWNFPLAHVQTENGVVYAVQDWMRGLIGGNVSNLISMMRSKNSQFDKSIKMFPYKSTDNKIYQRAYANEDSLMFILVNARLVRGRYRLAEIRNYIAELYPEYEYLKCRDIDEKVLSESEFQSTIVKEFALILDSFEIYQYYQTQSVRVIDIILRNTNPNKFPAYLLTECKVQSTDFYKAVGQVLSYNIEFSKEVPTNNYALAIAMPYEIIDDYMREISTRLAILLISIRHGQLIDGVSSQLITSADDLFATGKRLLANG